ncbi:hypothetical protein ACFSKU_16175 [Pontibacter silvestris]|uniref:STAS/SEC14 domain-containing protein n=1 Tax=Pontibacter silvestris TaxID=2305183 RepID=A0ABW4X1M9_9BACT|nr:hypothetical protein [Pontibacter silvestris]MCC9136008.1 hypothetical protein [Pontibacter silvestris]
MIVEEWYNRKEVTGLNQALQDKLYIEYQVETSTLVIGWEGDVTSKEIRDGYKLVLDLVHMYKPNKWVLDLTKREFIKGKDRRWVFTNIFSKALRFLNEDIFVAIIQPVDTFQNLVSELQGDELMYNENFLIINHFLYQEAGKRWLDEMSRLNKSA